MKTLLKFCFALLICAMLSNCASLFGDNTRTITINSVPQGADVYLDGSNRGATPLVLNLPTYIYAGQNLTLKKQGYKEISLLINSKFQLVGLWNILFLPGFIVDIAVGTAVKVDPMALNNTVILSQDEQPIKKTSPSTSHKSQE